MPNFAKASQRGVPSPFSASSDWLRREAETLKEISGLPSFSDNELHAAYDHVLEQFVLELLIGADKDSEWSDGKLVIAANHGPIHLLQAAFYAVRLELQRRKLG